MGRHVLEPANRVALDDAYQVEVFTHWIKSNYEVSANTEVDYGASYAYLQTLTNYNGSDKADDHVYRCGKLKVKKGFALPNVSFDVLWLALANFCSGRIEIVFLN